MRALPFLFMSKKERLRLAREEFYGFALNIAGYGLDNRELKVLLFRYHNKLTLQKTSEVLNGRVSRERIRQIERGALLKIKNIMQKRKRQCIL
jgi:DNA-directed RNA polymerase sigma subunit (sigma70/sigma32)